MSEKTDSEEKNTTATYPLRLEKDLLEKSKELAKRKGTTLASLIRMFLIKETEENQ